MDHLFRTQQQPLVVIGTHEETVTVDPEGCQALQDIDEPYVLTPHPIHVLTWFLGMDDIPNFNPRLLNVHRAREGKGEKALRGSILHGDPAQAALPCGHPQEQVTRRLNLGHHRGARAGRPRRPAARPERPGRVTTSGSHSRVAIRFRGWILSDYLRDYGHQMGQSRSTICTHPVKLTQIPVLEFKGVPTVIRVDWGARCS